MTVEALKDLSPKMTAETLRDLSRLFFSVAKVLKAEAEKKEQAADRG